MKTASWIVFQPRNSGDVWETFSPEMARRAKSFGCTVVPVLEWLVGLNAAIATEAQ